MSKIKISMPSLEIIVTGLVVMGLMGILFFAALEKYTTTKPEFCMTCHKNQGYTDFRRQSKIHPKKVGCIECHGKHGEIVSTEYLADDERVNKNCLRCHQDIPSAEKINFKYNVYKIKIPHKFHIKTVGVKCTDCHYNITHDKITPITNRPRMEACFRCHNRKDNCLKCHTKGAMKLSDTKEVVEKKCRICHPYFRTKKLQIFGIEYTHIKHLAAGIQCERCHSNVPVHGAISKGKAGCQSCHHKTAKSKCMYCHGGSVGLPKSANASVELCLPCHIQFKELKIKIFDTNFSHMPHLENGVDCTNCHSNVKKHGDILPTEESCQICHQGRKPSSHTANWRRKHGGVAKKDKQSCNVCHTQDVCSSCHKIEVPHIEGWTFQHGKVAENKFSVCINCHKQDKCLSCHKGSPPPSHETGWNKKHLEAGKNKKDFCQLCHGTNPCVNCHKVEMPHQSDWLEQHKNVVNKQGKELCAKCHSLEDFCKTCH